MTQIELINTLGTGVWTLDVIFITNQKAVPPQITHALEEKGFSWAKVKLDRFINEPEQLGSIGTMVVDTTEVTLPEKQKFLDVLKNFEKSNTAAILLNNEIEFPFENFNLAFELNSTTVDEMIGRIESNIAFARSLQNTETKPLSKRPVLISPETTEQLRMAGQVQRDFLPQQLPDCKKFKWKTIFHPADWVSGDIYDVTRLDEHHIGFYIADAVGHSMPAALLTMFLKQAIIMRQTTGNTYEIFEPKHVLGELNNRMVAQKLKGCLFATCCYCLLDTDTLKMTFARGGHPYPVLIRNGIPQQLENRGALIGVFADAEFEQTTVQLNQGDKLLLYSDGCESVIVSGNGENINTFTEQFCSVSQFDLEQMMTKLDQLLTHQETEPEQFDDMSAVGLEIIDRSKNKQKTSYAHASVSQNEFSTCQN